MRARATASRFFPGSSFAVSMQTALAEIHSPHLPALISQPTDNLQDAELAQLVGLLDLPIEHRSYGWQLKRPGARTSTSDQQRESAQWQSRIQTLADAAGESGTELETVVVDVLGPVSQWANLWLPSGQRGLRDYGARADLAEIWVQSVQELTRNMKISLGAEVILRVHEPDAKAIVEAQVPTASGYRTERAVSDSELQSVWKSMMSEIAADIVFDTRQRGRGTLPPALLDVVVSLLSTQKVPDHDAVWGSGMALPLFPLGHAGHSYLHWEMVEGLLKTVHQIYFVVPPRMSDDLAEPGTLGDQLVETWQDIGLEPSLIHRVIFQPAETGQHTMRDAAEFLEFTRELAEHVDGVVENI